MYIHVFECGTYQFCTYMVIYRIIMLCELYIYIYYKDHRFHNTYVFMYVGPYYRKAYKRNIAIKLFEKKKGLAAKRAAKREKKARLNLEELLLNDLGDDVPPEEEEEEDKDETADLEGFGVIGESGTGN